MNEWNKLSMADRAAYIKLGIDNGITDLATIRDTYNKFAEGGYYDNKTIEVTLPEIKFTLEELDCLTLTPQQVTLLLPFITE